jgi:hypothetical protein
MEISNQTLLIVPMERVWGYITMTVECEEINEMTRIMAFKSQSLIGG